MKRDGVNEMRCFYLIGFLVYLLFLSQIAWAFEYEHQATVFCNLKTGAFLIRFNYDFESMKLIESSLITPLNLNLQTKNPSNECHFDDGSTLKLSTYDTQVFGYGQGGADPDSLFTLYYKGTPLYYDATFYHGYGGSHVHDIEVLIYDGKQLKACSREPDDQIARDSNKMLYSKNCVDVSARLKGEGSGYSPEEKNAVKDDKLIQNLTDQLSSWCQTFQSSHPKPFESNLSKSGYVDVDLSQNGKLSRVFIIESHTHYFDGSYLVVIPKEKAQGMTRHRLENKILAHVDLENLSKGTPQLKKLNGQIISVPIKDQSYRGNLGNVSPRYIYNDLVAYENKSYIISRPTNEEVIPHLVLSQLLSDNTLKTLCVFPK
jgi:hypothetical protein